MEEKSNILITGAAGFIGAAVSKKLCELGYNVIGIDNINDVEKYKKAPLYVTREDAVPLGENEYFIADLIGLKVISDEGEALGILDDVLQTGANDVYVVKCDNGEEILVPAIKDCVKNVDIEGKEITLHLLPGLR